MRLGTMLIWLATACLVAACGEAHQGRSSERGRPESPYALARGLAASSRDEYFKGDDDRDDGPADDRRVRHYGRAATPRERNEIAPVVKRYFAAATAGSGAATCAMLDRRLSGNQARMATIPHDYALGGISYLKGKPCVAFMSLLLKSGHAQLMTEEATNVKVFEVRVKGATALAVLEYKLAPERYISLRREGTAWKIDAVLDTAVP